MDTIMTMTPETIAIVAVGIAVGVFIVYRVVKTVRGGSGCGCGCGCSSAVHLPAEPAAPPAKQAKYTVANMHCGNCENTVRQVLGRIPGVLEVTANYRSGVVQISYEGDGVPEAVRAKLNDIAFPVEAMELL